MVVLPGEPVPQLDQGVDDLAAGETVEHTYVLVPDSTVGAVAVPDSLSFEASFVTSHEPMSPDEANEDTDECAVGLTLALDKAA